MPVRLPIELVARIDERRGEATRAAYLDTLIRGDQEADVKARVREQHLKVAGRGSPSPSLKRFGT